MFTRLETGQCEPGFTSCFYLALLFDYCDARNVNPCTLLDEPRSVVADPFTPFPRDRLRHLLLTAAKHFNDPDFPLHLGASICVEQLGILGYALRSSADLRGALEVLLRYYHLFNPGNALRVHIANGTLTLHWDAPAVAQPIIEETIVAAMIQMVRIITGRKGLATRIDFRGAAPTSAIEYEAFFGCDVRFGQARAAVVAPESVLRESLHSAEHSFLTVLQRELDRTASQVARPSTIDQNVQRMVEKLASEGVPTAEQVADNLKVPVRQLIQDLANEGKLFRDVRDEALHRMAERYLRDPHLSLAEVAQRLGYSEQSAFTRSFRRWSGVSPRVWRRRIRG